MFSEVISLEMNQTPGRPYVCFRALVLMDLDTNSVEHLEQLGPDITEGAHNYENFRWGILFT